MKKRIKRLVHIAILFMAAFPFISSCIVSLGDFPGYQVGRSLAEYHKSVSLRPGGTLSLESGNGNVEIIGWERDELEMYVERNVTRSPSWLTRWQPWWRVVPKIDFDKFEDFIKIRVQPARRGENLPAYDFYLNVPHHIHLKNIVSRTGDIVVADLYGEIVIELTEGNVKVENFSGSLLVSLGEGSVEADLVDLRSEDEVRISTENGDIVLCLESTVRASVEANAPSGKVVNAFFPEKIPSSEKVAFELGEGGTYISLYSASGDIHIKEFK
ncbi:MAG: DUF4097 domain-containing protein [Candidatus Aminicenantes bacterium]|nr:DUF4097 domain-containing protein [Candidatus Aminicenantes bacterium]MDH5705400.1 DUF4097 domain-containing protein [Candidatus Aminicenantes bacterium]